MSKYTLHFKYQKQALLLLFSLNPIHGLQSEQPPDNQLVLVILYGGKGQVPMTVQCAAGNGVGSAAQHSQSLES